MSEQVTAAAAPTVARGPRGADGREPWLSTAARLLVHATTAAVFAWPLTVPEAVGAAAAGAGIGAFLARFVAQSRVRTIAVPLLLVLGLATTAFVGGLWGRTDFAAAAFGPGLALRIGDAIEFGFGALTVSATLRALSIRRPALSAIEVAIVALSFAQLVVAHQNGAINRPFEIADPIIAQGGDPTVALMAMGALAAATILLLLLSERNVLRGALHLGIVALLLTFGLVVVGLMPEPVVPDTGGGLGLRGDGDEEEGEEGQDSSGRRSNEELEFRDNYDNAQNRVPVGVVLLHDDYSPPTGVYYFRQGAFSQYNGRRLVAATRGDVDRDIARAFPSSEMTLADVPEAGPYRATIETTVALLADHHRPFALEAPVSLRPEPNPDTRRFKRLYRAVSTSVTADYMSMLGASVGDSSWSDEVRAHYTEAPADPRYTELSARIVEELPEDLQHDSVARALAVTGYLSREGTYSLRSRHADADDPTSSFLFGDLTGYCVHFAHATTYLLRTMDIPARVATGYAIDEASRQGGSAVLVTGQASHAWPEVYVAGLGWVVMDVAPETVITPPPGPPDADLQRLLAELVRGRQPLPVDGRPAADVAGAVRTFFLWAGRGLGAFGAVALLLMVLGRGWRQTIAYFARDGDRVVYRAALDTLSAVGIRRSVGESREAFARRVARETPSLIALTEGHIRGRFADGGQNGGRGAARGDARAHHRALRRELRRSVPFWRRALGWAMPWAWLLSR